MAGHVVIGTAGHIDHGKSALVRSLTGTDPDRLKEEQDRGITIDLGFAHLQSDDTTMAFVDVPGHERFVKNMLAGASGIDAVLLVVAADESVMPQTREHFDICRLLGVSVGVVASPRRTWSMTTRSSSSSSRRPSWWLGPFSKGRRSCPCPRVLDEGWTMCVRRWWR